MKIFGNSGERERRQQKQEENMSKTEPNKSVCLRSGPMGRKGHHLHAHRQHNLNEKISSFQYV